MTKTTFLLGCLLLLAGSPAQAGLKWVKTATVDLDGDKQPETLTLTAGKPFEPSFKLTAGKAKLDGKLSADVVVGFAVIDLDRKDKRKEILIDCSSEAGDFHHYLFVGYRDGKLVKLGEYKADLPSEPVIPGNRSVRLEPWFGFFKSTVKLGLSKNRLVEVKQSMYFVDITGQPKKSPTLWRTPDARQRVGILAPKKQIRIIGYRPNVGECKRDKTFGYKTCDWFLVRSSSGLVGWIRFQDLDTDNLPWAG